MAHLISSELSKQIKWWQWYSIWAPISFLTFSIFTYYVGICSFADLVIIGVSILVVTCISWWHWCLFTMIRMLSIMKDTDDHFETVACELSSMRSLIESENTQIH